MTCLPLNVRACTVVRRADAASGMEYWMADLLVLLAMGAHAALDGCPFIP